MQIRFFIITISLFIFTTTLTAQQPQSLKTEIIDGREYYIYTVQPRDGLYRISVNFGVTQEDILKANPEAKEGLKSGQILFIPKKGNSTPNTTSKPSTTKQTPASSDIVSDAFGKQSSPRQLQEERGEKEPHFYYHKVLKQQTLFSLSKQYAVTQQDIIKYNPEAAKGIKEGEILRIPKAQELYPEKAEDKEPEDYTVTYLIHVVEPKETLYAISKRYDVKVDDVLKINPGIEVLSIGQKLRIPYYPALTTTEIKDGEKTTFIDLEKINYKDDDLRTILKIAYLLPFSLESKNDASIARFVEFYAGALKSINEYKQNSISINVFTFDTGKSKETMEKIFAQHDILEKMDLIIGPAYSAQVPIATEFAKQNKIKILIPFTSKVADVETNPYIFQFNPGEEAEAHFLNRQFETRWKNMNYIFAEIENSSDSEYEESEAIKRMLYRNSIKYNTIKLSDPEINKFDSVANYNKKNFIIFNTDRFSTIQPYLKMINQASQKYDILLFEKYNWKNQATARPVGVYIAPFKSESEIYQLDQYNQEFTDLFNWEPSTKNPRYDLLGYDLTNYFISLLLNRVFDIQTSTELTPYKNGLQSEFHFKRSSNKSGFINQQLYVGESQIK